MVMVSGIRHPPVWEPIPGLLKIYKYQICTPRKQFFM